MKKKTKSYFKQEIISFNTEVAYRKNMYYDYLRHLSTRRNNGEVVDAEFSFIRSKLLEIEQNKLNALGYILKANVLSEDEKLSVFHVTTQNRIKRTIEILQDGESTTTDTERIKTIFAENFERTFNAEFAENEENFTTINYLNKTLNSNETDFLTSPISENELKQTLRSCSKKKSPGIDGLTYEFYIKNFDLIKHDLLSLLNRFLENPSEIPENFADGVITLIPKLNAPKTVNDFRPISLLNTDYKIFSKILANRLKDSIQKLIENGQSACLNGKSCVTNLTKLRNLIANKGRSRANKFAIMSLDLEKAFDRVKLAFLWKCLEKMNFPTQFIEVLKALYKNAKSRILINGTLTREIRIKNSVRQGCPLSMALFVIYIEPLIQMINFITSGTTLQQNQIKCMAYADDINFIVSSNDEIDKIFEGINTFCKEANAKLNFQKSSFMRVNNCNIGPQMIAEKDFLKILGITLYADIKQTVEKNYEKLLNNINYMINLHQRRNLNIIQKIWFANTFVLSKMWYLSQIIPPENLMLAKLRKTIGKFIWNGLLYKINRCQLFLSPKKGGLSLIDIEMKAKALFIKNILYKIEDNIVVPNIDFLLLETSIRGLLTRNMREWLTDSEDLQNGNLTSVKMLYFHFLDLRNHKPRVETEYPNIDWTQIWKNLSSSFLPTDWRAAVYLLVNDAVPNAARMRRHRISLDCPLCRVCGHNDDNIHRLRLCDGSVRTWNWLNHKLKNVLRLDIDDPEELLVNVLGRKEEAGLFLTIGVMYYNMKNYKEGTIREMENVIRQIRWSKRHILERKFGNLLNTF